MKSKFEKEEAQCIASFTETHLGTFSCAFIKLTSSVPIWQLMESAITQTVRDASSPVLLCLPSSPFCLFIKKKNLFLQPRIIWAFCCFHSCLCLFHAAFDGQHAVRMPEGFFAGSFVWPQLSTWEHQYFVKAGRNPTPSLWIPRAVAVSCPLSPSAPLYLLRPRSSLSCAGSSGPPCVLKGKIVDGTAKGHSTAL